MDDKVLEEHKESVRRNRMGRSTVWKWTSLILLILLLVLLFTKAFPSFNLYTETGPAENAIAFVNDDLLKGFATAELVSVTEEAGLYKLDVNLIPSMGGETQNTSLYLTKDGNLLFPSAIDLRDFKSTKETQGTAAEPSTNENDPILGNPDATLTIVEYSDFECPFCGQAYWTVKLVLDEYKDKVKLIYKNFPIPSHEHAEKAAEAGECANAQDKFAEYHDKLFENQDALNVDDLKQYAADLGLDTETFNSCLDTGAMAAEVEADRQEGIDQGVAGTPTFFIGEQTLVGNKKFSEFQTVIDAELAKMGEQGNKTEESPTTEGTTKTTIELSSSGFSPNTLTVTKGSTVTFVNTDTVSHWPASGVHPTHAAYPTTGGCIGSTFDACRGLEEGENFSFTFDEVGTWSYHDHLNPSLTGTVVVE